MIYFGFGFIVGAYVAQNYNIPNIENLFKECLKNLEDHKKK